MKKIFLAKRNALLSSAGASWGVVALALATVLLLVRLIIPNFFWYVTSPVLNASNTLANASHTFLASFGNIAALSTRNAELTNENILLASENSTLRSSVESLSGRISASGIFAKIASRPPESPYDSILVDAGAEEGVTVGQEAFGLLAQTSQRGGGIPLGVVSSVGRHFARITLFSAPRMVLSGWVGHTSIALILHGEGGGAMSASVSRSVALKVGDTVYAPGPAQLPVGTIVRVDSDPSSPSVALRIAPLLNPFSIMWVELRDVGAPLRGSFYVATSTP